MSQRRIRLAQKASHWKHEDWHEQQTRLFYGSAPPQPRTLVRPPNLPRFHEGDSLWVLSEIWVRRGLDSPAIRTALEKARRLNPTVQPTDDLSTPWITYPLSPIRPDARRRRCGKRQSEVIWLYTTSPRPDRVPSGIGPSPSQKADKRTIVALRGSRTLQEGPGQDRS